MKIMSVLELNQVADLSTTLRQQMERVFNILDDAYGVNRDVKSEGGHILYITGDCLGELQQFFNKYPFVVVEYVDEIQEDEHDFTESLVLLGDDYSVVIYIERKYLKEFPILEQESNDNQLI